MIIELPWFPKELKPNPPKHWRTKIKYTKQYKQECGLLTKGKLPDKIYPMNVIFHPPDNRHRDLDNCLASIKAGIDGICDSLGINDKNLRPITIDFGEKVKGGKVVIEIKEN